MIVNNPLSLLSKYRSALMGLAILGVLIGHVYDLGGIAKTDTFSKLLYFFSTQIHVGGFLFLSGYGIFYSLKGNSSTKEFYIKRIYRIVIPYLLLAVPYFLLFTVVKHESIWFFLSCVTTMEFWIHGNYHGMWYIALAIMLYTITPPIYHFVNKNSRTAFCGLVVAVIASLSIDMLLKICVPEYYSLISIGVSRVHFYFIGMIFGLLAKDYNNRMVLLGMCSTVAVLYGLIFTSSAFDVFCYYNIVPMLFWVMVSCVVLYSIRDITKDFVNRMLSWFGKYSLELYILHLFLWTILKFGMHTDNLYVIATSNLLAIMLCKPVHAVIERVSNYIKNK